MCSITTKRYIFNFELNRRVPNGMHGGVRGRSKSALLDLVISKKLVTVFLLAQAIHIKESVAGKLHSLLAGICDTRSKRG